MPSSTVILAFVGASLVVLVMPGPGVFYVVARSVAQGRRAGLVSALGLSAGALAHVLAATVGLSAILLTSATAFGFVKALGAGYLIYLGLKALLSRNAVAPGLETSDAVPASRLFADGVIVSLFNPKIAVFFLAFLPQFVDPGQASATQQILLLGLLYAVLAVLTDGSYALLAGSVRHWFRGRIMRGPLPRYLSGGVYLGLGVQAALAERPVR